VTELHDIVTSLLDKDGSCRDLNFQSPTWAGVEDLIGSLEGSFESVSGTDHQGRAITGSLPVSVLAAAQNGGHAHLVLEGGRGPIKNMQLFVSSEEDRVPFVEVTFFPADVEPATSLRHDFIKWADLIRTLIRARRYYARYENASWQFGDTGPLSGVFLVSDEVAEDA
jgi:hypothetical protein